MPYLHTVHIVVDSETNEETSYEYAYQARQHLCDLADAGVRAYIFKAKTVKGRKA